MKKISLGWRLLFPLIIGMTLVWGTIAVILALGTRHEINELLDAQMIQMAHFLTQHAAENEVNTKKVIPSDHDFDYQVHYIVWDKSRKIIYHDHRGEPLKLADREEGLWQEADTRYYIYSNPSTGISAMTSYSNDLLNSVFKEIVKTVWLPWISGFIILGLISLIVVYNGLSPLHFLTQQISKRSSEHLELFSQDVPKEMYPLVQELNRLLTKISKGIFRERKFTDNAAHELRTPLSAIKVQAEVLEMELETPAQKEQMKKVILAIDRSSHLVDQLLWLARVDSLKEDTLKKNNISLLNIAKEKIEELTPQLQSKKQKIEIINEEESQCLCDPTLIGVIMRNLIENASRYSSAESKIKIKLRRHEFSIEDQGTGIPEALLDRVGERFFRIKDHTNGGSGLGLSIVERICELYGFKLSLENIKIDNKVQGLRAKIIFKS